MNSGGEPLWKGFHTFCFEERREVLVREELLENARDNQEMFLGTVGPRAERSLLHYRLL